MASLSKRVLVVDDEPALREVLKALLSHFGCSIQTAGNALEALAKVEQHQFDLVLTDLLMPGMKGDQLALEINKRHPDLPVVLLTGIKTAAIVPGVSRVLGKPFSRDELRETVFALT